jgi:lipopolysaccharide/colanic/teichoic acid biosynthesis glycosyltransferase
MIMEKGQERVLRRGFYYKYGKRLMDIVFSLSALLILSPVILLVAALVRFKIGSPVLFKQERPGRREKIFTLYKFRTMTDERGEDGKLLPDELRLTSFGRFIRSTSLDELPELLNIIKGDMSIVGPRPLLVRYLGYYKPLERRRHEVKPGLTGIAQVSGRNYLGWEKRFECDVYYVDHITFLGDLIIILKTIKKVLQRKDIAVGDQKVLANLDEERGAS